MLSYFDIFAPDPPPHRMGWGGGRGLTKNIDFSTVHEMSQTFEIFTHKTPNPRWGGIIFVLLLFSAVHDISRTFDFLTP